MNKHNILKMFTLIILVSIGLTACAQQPMVETVVVTKEVAGESVEVVVTTTPAPEAIHLAMVMHQAIPYTAQIKAGWDAWCSEHLDEVICEYAVPDKVDPEKQIAFFEDFVTKGVDGIVTNCVPAELWVEPIKAARAQGILVNSVDCSCVGDSEWNVQVGPDYPSQGAVFAKGFFDELEKKGITEGQVIMGYCAPGYPSQEARMATLVEECEARGTYECVGNLDTGHNVDLDYSFWETAIIKYPDAVAYAGTCAFDGPNLLKLKRLTEGDWAIGTYDLEPDTLEGLQSSEILIATGANPTLNGYLSAELLYQHLASGEPLRECGLIDTPPELVSWENIGEYLERQQDLDLMVAYIHDLMATEYADLDAKIVDSPY